MPAAKLCLSFNTARLRVICKEDCANIIVAWEDVTCVPLCDAKWSHQSISFSFHRVVVSTVWLFLRWLLKMNSGCLCNKGYSQKLNGFTIQRHVYNLQMFTLREPPTV